MAIVVRWIEEVLEPYIKPDNQGVDHVDWDKDELITSTTMQSCANTTRILMWSHIGPCGSQHWSPPCIVVFRNPLVFHVIKHDTVKSVKEPVDRESD